MTKSPGSLCTPEMIDKICERLAEGESMRSICSDADMPSFRSVMYWEKDPNFRERTRAARTHGTHALADECLAIIDAPLSEEERANYNAAVAHRRAKVDTRLRLIGKWNSRDYGEKVQQEHSGGVVVQKIERVIVEPK